MIELVLPLIVPGNVYVLPEQIIASIPALTTAIGLISISIESVIIVQGPVPSGSLLEITNVTEPANISAAEGV